MILPLGPGKGAGSVSKGATARKPGKKTNSTDLLKTRWTAWTNKNPWSDPTWNTNSHSFFEPFIWHTFANSQPREELLQLATCPSRRRDMEFAVLKGMLLNCRSLFNDLTGIARKPPYLQEYNMTPFKQTRWQGSISCNVLSPQCLAAKKAILNCEATAGKMVRDANEATQSCRWTAGASGATERSPTKACFCTSVVNASARASLHVSCILGRPVCLVCCCSLIILIPWVVRIRHCNWSWAWRTGGAAGELAAQAVPAAEAAPAAHTAAAVFAASTDPTQHVEPDMHGGSANREDRVCDELAMLLACCQSPASCPRNTACSQLPSWWVPGQDQYNAWSIEPNALWRDVYRRPWTALTAWPKLSWTWSSMPEKTGPERFGKPKDNVNKTNPKQTKQKSNRKRPIQNTPQLKCAHIKEVVVLFLGLVNIRFETNIRATTSMSHTRPNSSGDAPAHNTPTILRLPPL